MHDQDQEKTIEQQSVPAESQQELALCKAQQEELRNKLIHAAADFENYKKRVEKERLQLVSSAQGVVLSDIISCINDLDRALLESQKQAKTDEQKAWLAGFELIKKSLYKLLQSYDVQEITQVRTFDPQLHEALMHVSSEQHKAGDIVTVLEKGFMLKDHVLKPAKVSVAQ